MKYNFNLKTTVPAVEKINFPGMDMTITSNIEMTVEEIAAQLKSGGENLKTVLDFIRTVIPEVKDAIREIQHVEGEDFHNKQIDAYKADIAKLEADNAYLREVHNAYVREVLAHPQTGENEPKSRFDAIIPEFMKNGK